MAYGRVLYIDIETYSSEDLPSVGLYKYVESDDFQVLLIQYAYDDEPVRVLDLAQGDEVPLELELDLYDARVVKVAHNCAFERTCLGKHFGRYMEPAQFEDTMLLAAYNGLPMSLDASGAALNIENKKLKTGASLITYFCKPCRPTISNGGRTRNLPGHSPERWEQFKEYGRMDVEAEREIYKRLKPLMLITEAERLVICCDARINERGVLVDLELAQAAVDMDKTAKEQALAEMASITGLSNPNSVGQIKDWLESRGMHVESLSKSAVGDMLTGCPSPSVQRVLQLRQLIGKTSTAKYEAMLRAACKDGRVRGITQYYGAGRTGRWAGRLCQLQNLPQNHLDDIGAVRELVRSGDAESIALCFDSVADTLSQLIRTAFIAKPGYTFLVADYSAIEARVIAYLAGEKWRLDTFVAGGDIYCASASSMFGVPVVKHGINGHLRQKGKVAELGCGYGGGINALKAFGADKMGLSDEELKTIVDHWREASPKITQFWRDAERAAKTALRYPGRGFSLPCGVRYHSDADGLVCRLPSGRSLRYWGARLGEEGIEFQAQNQETKRWGTARTWGGRLVENITQAVARDLLAAAMLRLESAGYNICFHVHDEIIAEEKLGSRWEDMAEIMAAPVSWAPGLPMRADGYATNFYMKD